jgi:fatty acid desaturase
VVGGDVDQMTLADGQIAGADPSTDELKREAMAVGSAFPTPEARELVRDLMAPKPFLYWVDFLFHVALGWGAFAFALQFSAFSLPQIALAVVSALALYRAMIFIHELAHRRERAFEPFRRAWNLLCGIPLLLPSFTYQGVHNDHHTRNIYGLEEDGEYVDFALLGRGAVIRYPFLSLVLPLIMIVRFLVLAPLSLLHPAIRRLVWERLSSLAIDMRYRRRPASDRDRRRWNRYEAFTFLFGAGAIALGVMGVLPIAFFGLWYGVAVLIGWLNSLRTLAAHRYRNPDDHVMGLEEQFLDSVDVPGHRFWTALWAPVGLRYHATHHLFPSLPYHALGEANRRLTSRLDDSDIYRAATRKSLWHALSTLMDDAARQSAQTETASGYS